MRKYAKLFTVFVLLIVATSSAYSLKPEIFIQENSKLVDNNRGFLSVESSGTLSIRNPSKLDEIYEFVLRFRQDSHLQLVLSDSANNSRFSVTSSKIYGREILPNETISMDYSLAGKVDSSHLEEIRASSVMGWYVEETSLDPLRFVTLAKLQRKDSEVPISPRKVIVKGENPTDFDVKIKYLIVFKTDTHNFSEMSFTKEILHTTSDLELSPHQKFYFEITDKFSDDDTVYWVESDFRTINQINKNFTYSLSRDTRGSSRKKASPLKEQNTDYDLEIYKTSHKSSIKENETLNITVVVKNPNNHPYQNLRVYEKVPSHFSLIPYKNSTYEIKNSSILFRFSSIEEDSFLTLKYKLKLLDKISEELIYIPPATLVYDDKEIYSNGLTLINSNYEEFQRLFVQKIIQTLDNGKTKITIKVKNIGNTDLREIGVIEDISTQILEGEEIDKQREQAKWMIRELKIGEEWETTYQIDTIDANKYIPQITGIDDAKVYKTIFINEEVREYYYGEPGFILKILAIFAIILLLTDIIF